jgi:hypothetical protein
MCRLISNKVIRALATISRYQRMPHNARPQGEKALRVLTRILQDHVRRRVRNMDRLLKNLSAARKLRGCWGIFMSKPFNDTRGWAGYPDTRLEDIGIFANQNWTHGSNFR